MDAFMKLEKYFSLSYRILSDSQQRWDYALEMAEMRGRQPEKPTCDVTQTAIQNQQDSLMGEYASLIRRKHSEFQYCTPCA